MTAENGAIPLTCGSCAHWQKQPIPAGAAMLNLGEQARGECRAVPPSLTIVPMGHGQANQICGYPPLPPNFPACAMHRARIQTFPASV